MAQTEDAISMVDALLELSTNGSAWTDYSGFSNSVMVDGGERATEETQTFEGDTPIITAGKRGSLEVKIKYVYTEGMSDPQALVLAAYENKTPLYARWSPKGGNVGDKRYTTGKGIVKSNPYPGGEAGSAAALVGEFTLQVAKITQDTVPAP